MIIERQLPFEPTNLAEALKLYDILERQCTAYLRDCNDPEVRDQRMHYRRSMRWIEKLIKRSQ